MTNEIKVIPQGSELIIRDGKAQELFPPRKVKISGNIEAPGEYFQKRWSPEIEALKDKTHVTVDNENLTISLVVNETDHHCVEVGGKLEFFGDFLSFNINRPQHYSVSGLFKMLRMKRAYFKNREDHALVLDQLKKFEANTEVQFKSTNDFKGSTALQKIQVCKTNLTYSFILNIPIYKGLPEMSFPVEIEFEPTDGSIVCWLVSEDLAELEIKQRDEIINAQVALFKDVVIIKK